MLLENRMLESNFLDLINDNYYMICIFDENKNVVSKNKKFNIFFQKLMEVFTLH